MVKQIKFPVGSIRVSGVTARSAALHLPKADVCMFIHAAACLKVLNFFCLSEQSLLQLWNYTRSLSVTARCRGMARALNFSSTHCIALS